MAASPVIVGVVVGTILGVFVCSCCLCWRKRTKDSHAHLDEEEQRFKSTLEKQADLDDLFDFDQDDIEFDENELEQLKLLGQAGDFLDSDDIELGVPTASPPLGNQEGSDDDDTRAFNRRSSSAKGQPQDDSSGDNISPVVKPKSHKPKSKSSKKRTGHAD